MSFSRRDFLRHGTVLTAGAGLAPGLLFPEYAAAATLDDGLLRQLATRALEAAVRAGARHAEVRLSDRKDWFLNEWTGSGGGVSGTQTSGVGGTRMDARAIGVRVLVGDGWGYASGTIWTLEEAARLGADAVVQARSTARAGTPAVKLAAAPVVKDGKWRTPVQRDPFLVSREEVLDTLAGTAFFGLRRWGAPMLFAQVARIESAFASSEGSFITQTRFEAGAKMTINVRPRYEKHQYAGPREGRAGYALPLAGRGWEYLGRAPWHEMVERMRAEQEEDLALPIKAVDVGRYDVVLDHSTAGRLLSATIGTATELDRALGYEANAGGSSYLNDPAAMLGKEPIGAALLDVTADRTLAAGLATVGWDDEGVAPEPFPLVKAGVLADFQTTRDAAPWLEEAYARAGRPVKSHGCAGGSGALDVTQLQRPNLRLAPGSEPVGFAEMIARMGNGIVVEEAIADMDFNALNGMLRTDPNFPIARFYEVKRGRKVARLFPTGTAVLFRAPELWKSVLALGGPASVAPVAVSAKKGEPEQETWHTVEAPPVLVRQQAVIDPTR